MIVVWLFLAVPGVGLQFVIVVSITIFVSADTYFALQKIKRANPCNTRDAKLESNTHNV